MRVGKARDEEEEDKEEEEEKKEGKFFSLKRGKKDGREVALEETRGTIESARRIEVEKRKGRERGALVEEGAARLHA